MKIKFNLTIEDILQKRFSVELRGYDAKEVDYFFDLIKKDYEAWQILVVFYKEQLDLAKINIENVKKDKRILENHVKNLQTQLKELENKGLSNVDIIQRINTLEEKNKK